MSFKSVALTDRSGVQSENVHHLLLVYECVRNTSLTHSAPPATFRLTAHGVSRLVAFVQEHKQQLAQQPGDPRTPEGRDFLY
jgi:hypothetical protein